MPNFERATPVPQEESSDRISGVRPKTTMEMARDADDLSAADVPAAMKADLPELDSSHLEQVAGPVFASDAERAFFQPEGAFISKKEAYTAIARRMEAINDELQDMIAAGGDGFEDRRKELMGEAKELSAHLRAVEAATGEETNGLVANPFQKTESAIQASETKDRGYLTSEEIETSLGPDHQPTREELQAEYASLKERNTEIGAAMKKCEQIEQQIVGMISAMHEGTSRMREDLRTKRLGALASLMGETFPEEQDLISRIEGLVRSDAREAGYPEMLNTVGASMERLADEKRLLLENMSKVIDRLAEMPEQAASQEAEVIPLVRRKNKPAPPAGEQAA